MSSPHPKRSPETGVMDYLMCGWRVRSELPLPELLPWRGDDRAPDLDIRLGAVPDPERPVEVTPFLRIGDDGLCRLAIDAVARYLVRDGRSVTVELHTDPQSLEIRVFLLGSVLGFICHQRGLFPLHASCVALGGGAVAMAGASGAGKSTLAATLARRGHALLADDVCVIDPAAAGGPAVLPTFPRVKLWGDSLDALAIPPDALDRNRAGQDKYHYRFAEPGAFTAEAVPLSAVYLLEEARPPHAEGVEPLNGFAAVTALGTQVYRRNAALRLGREPALFRAAAAVAAAAPLRRLIRRKDFGDLERGARMLEEDAAQR